MSKNSDKNILKKSNAAPVKRSKNLHLVVPNLIQYKDFTTEQFNNLKGDVLQFLRLNQRSRNLQYYSIAVEFHPTSKIPHLDILLIYEKSVQTSYNRFDPLPKHKGKNPLLKHGDLTFYKTLNEAILNYNFKEDKSPLSNLPGEVKQIINLQALKDNPYRFLQLIMLQDPLHFNLTQYARLNDLFHHISPWTSIKNKLRDSQIAAANLQLTNKPGFKFITRQIIETQLTLQQLKIFDSWSGYQTIVNYLNQISTYRFRRPSKTMNLLITGPKSIGKSALIWQQYPRPQQNPLSFYFSVYPMGMKDWFPQYTSEVYDLIYWNQAKLTSYTYDTILQILDGTPVMLPSKGSSHKKIDNPLIIMTSNMTLQQMIFQKFHSNKKYLAMSKQNLSVRIENVIVPEHYNLFLLQKLLVKN